VCQRLSTDVAALRGDWMASAGNPRSGSVHRQLIDALPSQPVVNAALVAARLKVDERTALRGLDRLTSAGVLREVTGRHRNRVWVAEDVFDLLDETQASIGRGKGRPVGPSRHLRKET